MPRSPCSAVRPPWFAKLAPLHRSTEACLPPPASALQHEPQLQTPASTGWIYHANKHAVQQPTGLHGLVSKTHALNLQAWHPLLACCALGGLPADGRYACSATVRLEHAFFPPPFCPCSKPGHFRVPNPIVPGTAMCMPCDGCPTASCGANGCTTCPNAVLNRRIAHPWGLTGMDGKPAMVCRNATGGVTVSGAWCCCVSCTWESMPL